MTTPRDPRKPLTISELRTVLKWRGTNDHFSDEYDRLFDTLKGMTNENGEMRAKEGLELLYDHITAGAAVMFILLESLTQEIGPERLADIFSEQAGEMIKKLGQVKNAHDSIKGTGPGFDKPVVH